ncbi:MAG: hypothetical protein ACKVQU_25715 [Burkholderiales bacterium]
MCGLCGVLGGLGHWTESQAAPDAFAGREHTHTSTRERLDRSALVNQVLQHYRMNLKPWSGSSYVLRGGTGKTVLVENLSQMWAAAEKMTGLQLDPLDEALIRDLRAQGARD